MYITDTNKKYINLRTCEYPEFIKAIDNKILSLMEEFIKARARIFDTTEYIQEISNANNNSLQTSVTYGNGNGNGNRVNDGVDVKDKIDELKYRIEELYKIHEELDKMYMKYVLDGKTWEETKN